MRDRSRETRILSVSLYWNKKQATKCPQKLYSETERLSENTIFPIQIENINDQKKDPDLKKSINIEAGSKWNVPPNLQFQKVSLVSV